MVRILLMLLLGLSVIIGVPLLFYYKVGIDLPLSTEANDWAIFGSYFGGVGGALLSFLSVLLLILYTIKQQSDQSRKRDLLQYISEADNEINNWLNKKLATYTGNKSVEFGDIVWGIVAQSYANQKEYGSAIDRLYKLTCTYCASLGMYKDKIDNHFVISHHIQKAGDLIEFLEKNYEILPQIEGTSLTICKDFIGNKDDA